MPEEVATDNQPSNEYVSPFPNIRYADEAPSVEEEVSEQVEEATPESEATAPEEAAEDVGTFVSEGEDFDPNSPEYKHFQAAYTRKRMKESEDVKTLKADYEAKLAALESKPPEEAASADEPSTESQTSDPYTVSFDDFTPSVSVPEDSELSGLEEPLSVLIKDISAQAITHVLGQLRQRNEVAEQNTRVMTAREKVESYVTEAQLHPDYESKVGDIGKMVKNPAIQKLAVDDPDTFITLMEAKTGIARGWSAQATSDEPAPVVPQRAPANKARAATPRGTGKAPTSSPAKDGFMSLDDALDKALSR